MSIIFFPLFLRSVIFSNLGNVICVRREHLLLRNSVQLVKYYASIKNTLNLLGNN